MLLKNVNCDLLIFISYHLRGLDFAWYCSFFPVAEKTNQKKLVASIARLPVPATHNPTEATGYTFLIFLFFAVP